VRVSGFARFLPLSQREPADESGVSGDRRAALADVVAAAADLLAEASAPAAAAERFLDVGGLRADDRARHAAPGERVRAVATAVRAGRRRSIRALARAVRAQLELARDLGRPPRIDPFVAGAAALYACTTAPGDRRAVVRGHTVRATDADWAFGRGPVLAGRSVDIAAFLLGVSDDPPQPPATTRR
jgi:hypothetical protein